MPGKICYKNVLNQIQIKNEWKNIVGKHGQTQEFYQGGLDFFLPYSKHPLGPKTPLETIQFTDPGGGWSPIATPCVRLCW